MTEQQRHRAVIGSIIIALVLIGLGFLREEFNFILRRAVNICLECIGIG